MVVVSHKLLAVVGGLLAASVISEAVLGWVLGLQVAWLAVFVAAALIGVLVTADARVGEPNEAAEEAPEQSYDPVLCAIAGIAIVGAVACLYLPLPWGGLAAAAVVVGLVVALRLSQDHP